jgi:hypothetical protein
VHLPASARKPRQRTSCSAPPPSTPPSRHATPTPTTTNQTHPMESDTVRSRQRGSRVGTPSHDPAAGGLRAQALASTGSAHRVSEDLVSLIYELLDAHRDTADLAGGLGPDERWAAHLDYLRALQRMGRRALAEATVEGEKRATSKPPLSNSSGAPRGADASGQVE